MDKKQQDKLTRLLNAYLTTDYAYLVHNGKQSFIRVYSALSAKLGEVAAMDSVLLCACLSVAADGRLSENEAAYFSAISGKRFTSEQFLAVVKKYAGDEQLIKAESVVDGMSAAQKEDMLNICLSLCAVDKRMVADEARFIVNLLG